MEGLKNIIGVTRTLPTGSTLIGADISESGIYLDENSEINFDMMNAARDASEGNLYELMNKAKLSSFTFLKEAVLAGLTTFNRPALNKYVGFVGSPLYKGTLQDIAEGEQIRLEIATQKLESVYIRIKRLGIITDTSANVAISLPASGRSFEVVAAANTPSYFDIPKEQPLQLAIDGSPIVLEYTAAGFKPKANVVNCGCSAKDNYLAGFFEKGFKNQQAYGLILDCEIYCLSEELIELNYTNNEAVAASLARSLYYKASELLIESIISSGDVNRYTMLDTQHLYGKRNHFRKEYQSRINWLVSPDGIDIALNSCFICGSKAKPEVRKSKILI